MSYKSKSIKAILKEIEESKLYLPALQRKFVWKKQKIQLLFDSIMRNYPIGTFLFWQLKKEKADTYVFYEFLKEYDQRNPYNRRKTGSFLHNEITGVLDGQQRLSSIYIGLQGTHTERARYKRETSDDAYQKTYLYLNLLSLPYNLSVDNSIDLREDQNYEFRFLTSEQSETYKIRKIKTTNDNGKEIEKTEIMFWFKVGEILKWNEDPEIDLIIDNLKSKSNLIQKGQIESSRRFIKKSLGILHKRMNEELINYFEITKDDLEDILKIFIRVNSGGLILSKADLLFSTIVATWDDGREKIEDLLKKINNHGDKFNFSNEYLMRCCLALSDAPVLYKVNSFNSKNVEKIKNEWNNIAEAINKTVNLLVEFGFSGNLLTSQNATIIIAYYIYKGGNLTQESKKSIKKYLIHALLTGIYGSSQDQLLAFLRNSFRIEEKDEQGKPVYKTKYKSFSFEEFLKLKLPSRKTLYISEPEIETYLTIKKSSQSFFVLSLLYPNLRYNEKQFHQDHIHPDSQFNKDVFEKLNLTDEQKKIWLENKDMIPNLQLMDGRQNESKNATPFKEWIDQKTIEQQNSFCLENYISTDIDFNFSNFENFFETRKVKLKEELMKVLAISRDKRTEETDEFEDLEFNSIENGNLE